jgi:hypothetical protein
MRSNSPRALLKAKTVSNRIIFLASSFAYEVCHTEVGSAAHRYIHHIVVGEAIYSWIRHGTAKYQIVDVRESIHKVVAGAGVDGSLRSYLGFGEVHSSVVFEIVSL